MSIQDLKINAWQNPIVNEADRPNRSAANMKEIFDSNTNELRDALNGVIDEVAIAAETVRTDLDPLVYLRGDGTYGVPAVGEAANGVPALGQKGQILVKKSAQSFDLEWADAEHVYDVTIPLSAWTNKRCTIAVEGVTERSVVEIIAPLSDYMTDKQLEALQAANIQDGGQTDGSITLVARGDQPEIDLPIRVIVRGAL